MKPRKVPLRVAHHSEGTSSTSIGWILAALWAIFLLGHSFTFNWFQFTFLEDFLKTIFSGAIFRVDLGLHLLEVCSIWFLFVRLGSVLARLLHLKEMTRIEYFLISAGLGSGMASLMLFGLGLCGLWGPKLLCAIFFTGVAICLVSVFLNAWHVRRRGGIETTMPRPDSASLPQERPDVLRLCLT